MLGRILERMMRLVLEAGADNVLRPFDKGELKVRKARAKQRHQESRKKSKVLYDTFDEFTIGYVQAMLFSSYSDDDEGAALVDKHDALDIHVSGLKFIQLRCKKFQRENAVNLKIVWDVMGSREAGQNFLYSVDGHGTGFWDIYTPKAPEIEKAGKALHKAANMYPPLYVGVEEGSDMIAVLSPIGGVDME